MGTSMTLSEREKSKVAFRNHAMPRSKIPPEMERYYRYKAEYLKNKTQQQKNSQNPLAVQNGWIVSMPNEIPSIEGHSEILNPKACSDHIQEQESIEESQVEEWKFKENASQQAEKNVQSSELFMNRPNNKKSNFQPKSTFPLQQQNDECSLSNLPHCSQHNKNQVLNRNSSNKKSSNKRSSNRPQSQSNHALSQIIFHREGQISTYMDKFISEDIRQEVNQLKYRQSQGYQRYQLKFVEEGQNEQEDDQQTERKDRPTKQSNFKIQKTNSMVQQKISVSNKIKSTGQQIMTKINPHNLILQINSSIKTGCQNSIKPILLTNLSCMSKNTNTNLYSNSLSSSGRPRKLIYF